ncbi:MAG TPA: ATP-grasp domain-containing protein [Candidatus Binataceae bacterium]|nr:ATP-grasp domain-containing protein [Candidatus Binataceae bacterium]
MTNGRFKALLVGVIDAVGASRLPKLLHQAGCRVTLFAPRGLMVGRSRYVDEHAGTSHDAGGLALELRDWLARQTTPYDLTVVADEVMLHELTRWRAENWASRLLPVRDDDQRIDMILSKHKFMSAAAAAGLPVPREESFDNWQEALATANQIGFPVVIKKPVGFAGSGVRKAVDPEDLRLAYDQLGGEGHLMMEDFIPGPVGMTEALFDRGRLIAWASNYKIKTWPTPLSPSCVRQIIDHRDVCTIARGIGALTTISGFVGIDWIHEQEKDRLVLIELNPRPTPGLHLGPHAGVNFAQALRSILEGKPIEQRPDPSSREILWMFPQALHRAIDDHDPGGILKALRDAPLDDPALTATALRRVATHYLPTMLRRNSKVAAA